MVILLIAQFYVPIIGSIVVLTFISTSSAIVTTFNNGLILETIWKKTRNERFKVHEMEQLY
jgi:hypothetical protein